MLQSPDLTAVPGVLRTVIWQCSTNYLTGISEWICGRNWSWCDWRLISNRINRWGNRAQGGGCWCRWNVAKWSLPPSVGECWRSHLISLGECDCIKIFCHLLFLPCSSAARPWPWLVPSAGLLVWGCQGRDSLWLASPEINTGRSWAALL